jgi:hypothetical protein
MKLNPISLVPTSPKLVGSPETEGIVRLGLVAEYRLDEGGGQVITDYSGKGYHGVLGATTNTELSDPVWTRGGLTFASTSRCKFGNLHVTHFIGKSQITLVVVLKRSDAETGSKVVFANYVNTSSLAKVILYFSNNNIIFGARSVSADSLQAKTSVGTFTDANWGVFTGAANLATNSVALYYGPAAIPSTGTISFGQTTFSNEVGGIAADQLGVTTFVGDIGYVLIYDRVLSPTEISQNYVALKTIMRGRGVGIKNSQ